MARPDEEVVDQGAGFDARTLITRRRVLGIVGIGFGAATLAACSASDPAASSSTGSGPSDGEIPEETNGPYPADGTNNVNVLERSGIVRRDITSSLDGGTTVEGVPLTLTMVLSDLADGDAPFEGAAVYVWQCDAAGLYSMYSSSVENETYLRGVQVADADGSVTFETIVPGCYTGRWPHIHFEVYPDLESATDVGDAIATSQLAFPPEMLNKAYALDGYAGSAQNMAGVGTQVSDDGIFGEGDWELQVPTMSGDVSSGYTAELAVGIDLTTEPDRSGLGGGQPPAGGGKPPAGGEQPPTGNPPSGAMPADGS